MEITFLIARVILGLGFAAHGAQKLFGWFGGGGIKGTAGFISSLGFRPATFFTLGLGLSEFTGGTLTALGLLGPIGPALVILVTIVAMRTVHRGNGFFATNNGIELPLIYATGVLLIASTGHGPYSLDAMLGLDGLWTPARTLVVLALGAAGAIINLLVRRAPASA